MAEDTINQGQLHADVEYARKLRALAAFRGHLVEDSISMAISKIEEKLLLVQPPLSPEEHAAFEEAYKALAEHLRKSSTPEQQEDLQQLQNAVADAEKRLAPAASRGHKVADWIKDQINNAKEFLDRAQLPLPPA